MKASQRYTQFDITVSSHHTESLCTIEMMPQVKSVKVLDICRYHVITKRNQYPSLFKCQLPNITMICKYNVLKKQVDTIVSDMSFEDHSSSEDSEQERQKIKRNKEKIRSRLYGDNYERKNRSQFIKLEREADARLRRELEQIKIEMMLGMTVDTPDESSKYRPEQRFFSNEVNMSNYHYKHQEEDPKKRFNLTSSQEISYYDNPSKYYQ